MKNQQHLSLNLASHPVRNRRLFVILTLLVGSLLVILITTGVNGIVKYGLSGKNARDSIESINQEIVRLQRESKGHANLITQAKQENGKKVELINQIIYRKSFSWLTLLSRLEELLPDACYIVSLAPAFHEDASMDIRFKVASPNLDTLMILIDRLNKLNFTHIRLLSENRDQTGYIVYEISVGYERNI